MRLKIYPAGEKDVDRYWTLELTDEDATLRNHKDKLIERWEISEIHKKLVPPSFWLSRTYFTTQTKSETLAFEVNSKQTLKIRRWLDECYVRLHPDAATRILLIAAGMTVGGILLAIGGIVATLLSYAAAANKPENDGFIVFHGIVLCGVVLFIRGVVKAFQYWHWKAIAQELSEDEADE
jgi:hypothetical protein